MPTFYFVKIIGANGRASTLSHKGETHWKKRTAQRYLAQWKQAHGVGHRVKAYVLPAFASAPSRARIANALQTLREIEESNAHQGGSRAWFSSVEGKQAVGDYAALKRAIRYIEKLD